MSHLGHRNELAKLPRHNRVFPAEAMWVRIGGGASKKDWQGDVFDRDCIINCPLIMLYGCINCPIIMLYSCINCPLIMLYICINYLFLLLLYSAEDCNRTPVHTACMLSLCQHPGNRIPS